MTKQRLLTWKTISSMACTRLLLTPKQVASQSQMAINFVGTSSNSGHYDLPMSFMVSHLDDSATDGSDIGFATATGSLYGATGSIGISVEAATFGGWSVDAYQQFTVDEQADTLHARDDGWGVINGRIGTTQLLMLQFNVSDLTLPPNTGLRIAAFSVNADFAANPRYIVEGKANTKLGFGTEFSVSTPISLGENNPRIGFTDGPYNLLSLTLQTYNIPSPLSRMVIISAGSLNGYADLPMSLTIDNLDDDANGSDNEFATTSGWINSATGSISVGVEAASFGAWSVNASHGVTIETPADTLHSWADGWGVISGRIGATQLLMLDFDVSDLHLPADTSLYIGRIAVNTENDEPTSPSIIVEGQSNTRLAPSTDFEVDIPLLVGQSNPRIGFTNGPYNLYSLTLETYPAEASPSTTTKIPTSSPTIAPSASPTPETATAAQWETINYSGTFQERHESCFVMVDRKAYLIGGRGDRRVDIYDPSQQQWTAGADPDIEIHHFQCVAVDDAVYLPSVWTGTYPYEVPVDVVMVYNTTTDTWYNKTAMPEWRRRGGAAAVLVGRDIYVSHGNKGGHGGHARTLGFLDVYHVDSDTWTTKLPDAPNPRDHTGGSLMADGRICVAGGRNTGVWNWNEMPILPTDCYDPATNSWTVEADIPQGRAGSAYGTTCDGRLMVAGGEGFGQAWDRVDVFDGQGWTSMDSLNQAVHGTGLAVDCTCNQIHIASGSPNQGGGQSNTTETLFLGGSDASAGCSSSSLNTF